jgi:hypothetical protein
MSKKLNNKPPKTWLEKTNADYAFVLEGGEARVFTQVVDPDFGCTRVQAIKPAAFKAALDNQLVDASLPDAKKPKLVGLGTYWMKHAGRRQHLKGTTLIANGNAPDGYYNLWTGWGVELKKGDWPLMQWHIMHIVCGNNQKLYDYLIRWMARAVQKPEVPGETAIVLKGKKGTGKGRLGNALCKLFGGHALHFTKSDQLVGRFNAHLRTAIFIFADEAFFAGDKKNEGSLKALITEETVAIEAKGVDLVTGKNRTHIMMATNNDWAVPSSAEERRFFVVEVSDEMRGDFEYFKKLKAEQDQGGLAAMLYDLQTLDISDFNVRDIPQTAALLDQKILSLTGTEAWLYDCLQNGSVLHRNDNETDWDADGVVFAKNDAYDAFVHRASVYRCARDIPVKSVWSKRIREIVGADDCRPNSVRSLKLPPLDQCRAKFEAYLGQDIEWSEPVAWTGGDDYQIQSGFTAFRGLTKTAGK